MDLARFLASCPPDPREVAWAPCAVCAAPLQSGGGFCTGAGRHPTGARVTLYATLSNTRRNLNAMHAEGARVLVGPDQLSQWGRGRVPPLAWAVDNGAWGCFQKNKPFNDAAFSSVVDRWGEGADWIVAPDIVAGGLASLEKSRSWLDRLVPVARTLIAVQDGIGVGDVQGLLDSRVGIFVGGTTDWKWRTLPVWGELARSKGCYLHVGRVNSARAVRLCASMGANSCDGTSMSLYSVTAPLLGRSSREPVQLRLGGLS